MFDAHDHMRKEAFHSVRPLIGHQKYPGTIKEGPADNDGGRRMFMNETTYHSCWIAAEELSALDSNQHVLSSCELTSKRSCYMTSSSYESNWAPALFAVALSSVIVATCLLLVAFLK